jgi:hypothetical protein
MSTLILTYQSVIQNWLILLPMMQQTVLLSALRGPDGMAKVNIGKNICRHIRRVVLVDASQVQVDRCGTSMVLKQTSFMGPEDDPGNEIFAYDVACFIRDWDCLPFHFVMHILHAVEIIGYHHPDEAERDKWGMFYAEMCDALHLGAESVERLDFRLKC